MPREQQQVTEAQRTRLRELSRGRRGNASVTNDATERALIRAGLVRGSVETQHRYGPLTKRGRAVLHDATK